MENLNLIYFHLAAICLVTLIEPWVVGWKNSSAYLLWNYPRGLGWDLFSFSINMTKTSILLVDFFALGIYSTLLIFLQKYSFSFFPAPAHFLQVLVAVVAWDFVNYWNHRLNHSVSYLWNFHEFHHSTTVVVAMSTQRSHPISQLIKPKLFVLLLFGDQMWASGLFLVAVLWGYFTHSRIDTSLGWVGRYLLVSPRYHHLHHAKGEEGRKNYAEIFVFWDRIFGTYLEPNRPIAGISQGLEENFYENGNPVVGYLKPFGRLYSPVYRPVMVSLRILRRWLRSLRSGAMEGSVGFEEMHVVRLARSRYRLFSRREPRSDSGAVR